MKYLILLRHAHAKNPFQYSDDFERPLSRRGKTQCHSTGAELCGLIADDIIPAPDLILSSSAVRTRETVEIIREVVETNLQDSWSPAITYDRSLYLPSLEELMVSIWSSSNGHQSIFLCSHNPGITYLAEALFGQISGSLGTADWIAGKFEAEEWSQINKINSEIAGTGSSYR